MLDLVTIKMHALCQETNTTRRCLNVSLKGMLSSLWPKWRLLSVCFDSVAKGQRDQAIIFFFLQFKASSSICKWDGNTTWGAVLGLHYLSMFSIRLIPKKKVTGYFTCRYARPWRISDPHISSQLTVLNQSWSKTINQGNHTDAAGFELNVSFCRGGGSWLYWRSEVEEGWRGYRTGYSWKHKHTLIYKPSYCRLFGHYTILRSIKYKRLLWPIHTSST